MTLREKVAEVENIPKKSINYRCPEEFSYLNKSHEIQCPDNIKTCEDCWNREYKEVPDERD